MDNGWIAPFKHRPRFEWATAPHFNRQIQRSGSNEKGNKKEYNR